MKERLKRAGALILAFVILITTCFASLPEGSLSGLGSFGEQVVSLFGSIEAEAASDTTTVHLSQQYGKASVSEIGRSNESLWFFTTNSTPSGAKSTIFCLNSAADLHQDKDTYTWTTSNAVTYSDTNLAKAMTWWFGTHSDCVSEGSYTYEYNGKSYTLTAQQVHAAVQGYCWAYKKGKNTTTTIKQVLTNYCGISGDAKAKAAATSIVSAISSVHVYGTIYEYTCQKCGKSGSASSHQKMLGWSPKDIEPETDYVQYSDPATGETSITITINKKDYTSGSLIDTAKFKVQFAGADVSNSTNVKNVSVSSGSITGWSISMITGTRSNSTFTTDGGVVKFTYTVKYQTKTYTTQVYTYVTNWNQLSYWQKKTLTNKGYYSNKSDADSDAKAELKQGLNNLKSTVTDSIQSTKITVTETYCPKGYGFDSTVTKSKTPSSKKATFTFQNPRRYGKVVITKTAKKDASYTGDDATLEGAVYEIHAAETINVYGTKYSAGDVIYYNGKPVTATTNKNGIATTSTVLPAGFKYYAIETQASVGYELDTEKHSFTIGLDRTTGVVTNASVSSKEPQTWGYVSVTKTKENADGSTSYEKGATFYVVKASDLLAYFGTDSEDDVINALNEMGESERQAVILGDGTNAGTGYAGGKALKTNASGYAKSGVLPYGDYFLIQTDGDDACELATPKFVSITKGSGGTDNYEFTNTRTTASIKVTKTMAYYTAAGKLTRTAEAGATFVVLYASKVGKTVSELNELETATDRQKYVDSLGSSAIYATLVTDKNGEASTEVDTGVEYIVYQIDGEEGLTLAKAKSITLADGETDTTYYAATNWEYQNYFYITKKYEDLNGNVHAESGAEFVIVEKSAMTDSIANVTAMDADERSKYVDSLKSSAIIGTITTNSSGVAYLYWSQLEHSGDFVVIQISGVEGCALMDVLDSANATADGTGELSMKVSKTNNYDSLSLYTFSYTDEYTEWAKIDVRKTYESANGVWENEEGAEFTVTDYFTGEEVAWVVTDSTGHGVACDADGNEAKLPYGSYIVTQTATGKGAENTTLAVPEIVILTKQNRQQTVTYTAENPSEGYLFTLTKLSDDTGAPVSGATYAVVAAEDILNDDGSVAYEKGVTVTSITTGDDGTGDVWLPYGYYYAVETESPVTFVTNDEKYYFTLDADGITVDDGTTTKAEEHTDTDEEGNTITYYSVGLTATDTPVYGSIYVTKDGQVVSGKAEGGGFTYTSEALEGAVFALYARDDIYNDAGEVVWAAGTYITSATTDSTGTAQFYWNKDGKSSTGEDGNECADFYLGNYYVVETYAPPGFVCDTTEHDIGLTWNTSPAEKNDMSDPEESSALYDTENDWESSGDYVLMTGEDFNSLISDAVTITFTWSSPASGTKTTDVSHDGNSSTSKVVMWDDGNGNYYVSTCNSAKAVIFNGNSSNMFANCTSLTAIYFDNVDTSQVIDMRYMFYMCTGLTRLDLTNFDTTNVQYTDYMFMGCSSLEKIYVTEPGSTGSTDYVYTGEEYTSEITAAAASTVMEGDTITWENFYYTRLYRVDYIVEDNMESIELSASDIASVSPSVASQDYLLKWIDDSTYTMEVEITLSKSCKYYCTDGTYSNTLTAVLTVTIPDEDAELQTQEHAMAELALSDTPVTVSIEIEKEDPDGNDLEGAEFALYANCDIVNADGTIIYQAGQEITSNTSGGEDVPVMSFSGLPTDLYAVDGTYLAKQSKAIYCYAGGTTGSTAKGNCMFYVIETKAPNGHELDDSVWYLTGSISDYVASADDDFDGVISYGFTAVNTPLDYLTLEKAWDDSSFSTNRPDYVVFKATATGGTTYVIAMSEDTAYLYDASSGYGSAVYNSGMSWSSIKSAAAANALCSWNVSTYTESGENGTMTVWRAVLDSSYTKISSSFSASPFTDDSGYTFAENDVLLEKLMKNANSTDLVYSLESEGWLTTDEMVWRATNTIKTTTTEASVMKVWETYGDDDVELPTSLSVTLYQKVSGGTPIALGTRTLSESNNWYFSTENDATLHDLDKYDNGGNEYEYYWVETVPSGFSQTSHEYDYDEENDVWYTIIKNTTTITVDASVEKVWDDYDDVDGLRPDVIYVQLYADGVLKSLSTGNALALSESNSWKATVTGLPKYNSSGEEIKYTFKEVTDTTGIVVDKNIIILKSDDVSWYTGDAETGYKVTYGYADSTESGTLTRVTSITNTHKPLGEITIQKTVAVDDVIYYADAHDGENPAISFLFTYADGKTETLELKFDAKTVEADDTDNDGYVTLSKTYTDLDYGTYSVEELSQPEGWVFSKLTVTNGTSVYATTESREAEFTISAETASNTMIASYEDEYSPKGTITVTKTISEEELQTYLDKYDADPSVTFTLSTDSAGTKVVETQTVTFTADSVAKDGYVTESATFENVELGTYFISETSMPDTWDFVSLTGTNGSVNESKQMIKFTLTKANALETFAAVFTDKYPTGEVTVYKKVLAEEVEAYGEDAKFTFTLYDGNHKEVEAKTVTIAYDDCVGLASGEYMTASATLEALELGEYYLEETDMPDEWEFVEIASVTNGQVISGGDDPDSVYFYLTDDTYKLTFETVYVDEYINGSITIIKYDNTGKKVDGVTYTLYDADGNTVGTKTTGEDGTEGTVLFEELKKGTYYVTETNTASGLTLLADTITVTIPMVITDEEIAAYKKDYGIVIDTTDAVAKNGEYWFYDLTYEVTDNAELSMPMSGGVGTLQIVLLAIGFALLTVVVVISVAKRTAKITKENMAE